MFLYFIIEMPLSFFHSKIAADDDEKEKQLRKAAARANKREMKRQVFEKEKIEV